MKPNQLEQIKIIESLIQKLNTALAQWNQKIQEDILILEQLTNELNKIKNIK